MLAELCQTARLLETALPFSASPRRPLSMFGVFGALNLGILSTRWPSVTLTLTLIQPVSMQVDALGHLSLIHI